MTAPDPRSRPPTTPGLESGLLPFANLILARHRDHGGITEIRIIGKGAFKGIWAGYFTPEHVDLLIKTLLPQRSEPRAKLPYGDHPRIGEANIYFGLHPVDRALLARSAGRIQRAEIATTDADIIAFDLVAIDIDPVRKADISATEEEKAKAFEVSERILPWLDDRGVIAMRADSGNGYHLLIPTIPYQDVPTAAERTRRLFAFLKTRFATPDVEIDQTIYNPSRILKLYGTKAVKGDHIPERPHRFASIDLTTIPENVDLFFALAEELEPTSEASTRLVAEEAEPSETPAATVVSLPERKARKQGWNHETSVSIVGALLEHAGLQHRAKSKGDRTIFEFETCPHHTDPDGQTFECCVIVEGSGSFSAKCQHDANAGWRDFKSHLSWAENISEVLVELGIVKQGSSPRGVPETPAALGVRVIDYVTNRDHVNSLFDSVLAVALETKRFYNLNGEMVFIVPGHGLPRVREANVNAYLGSFLELAYYRETKYEGVEFQRFGLLPRGFLGAFSESPRILKKLPVLRTYTRSPLFTPDWRFVGTPGFHPDSGTYYDGPCITPATMSMARIEEVLGDFRWRSPVDKTNVLGMLLTAITMLRWINNHPFIAANGNRPGVGKTTLAKVLAIIVDGHAPRTVSYTTDDTEFEKQLATRVDSGDRMIVIDNAKKSRYVSEVESQVLERSITDGILNYRRLGGNSSISRENDVIFVLTMNFTKLSRDLRRRNVPVNLELPVDARNVTYKNDALFDHVLEYRNEIIAELAGMVERYVAAGHPAVANPARHSVGQAWAATIDSILRHSGFDGFLENFDDSEHAFDPNYPILMEICSAHRDLGLLSAGEWAPHLIRDVMKERLADKRGNPRPERAQATLVGTFFSNYVGTIIDLEQDGRWLCTSDQPRGAGHTTLYGFQKVEAIGG